MYSSQYLSSYCEVHQVSVFSQMTNQMKNCPHSSLYYFLVYAYSILFGDDKSLRLLSVLFSMLSLGILYTLSRQFFNRTTSLCALLIMAFHPFHLWYAQEARAYTMACFFSLLFITFFLKALKTNKTIYWFCLPIAGIFAIFSSYHFGFLLLASGLVVLLKNNRPLVKKWFVAFLFIGLFLIIFRPILSDQLSFVKKSFWLVPPSGKWLFQTAMAFTLGYTGTGLLYRLGLSLFLVLFLYGVYSSWGKSKLDTTALLLFLFFPIMATYIFSKVIMPIYITRQLIIFSPFYYLFIAKGIDATEHLMNKRIQTLAAILVFVLLSASLINYYRNIPHRQGLGTYPFRGIVRKQNHHAVLTFLDEEFKEEDIIVVADLNSYYIALNHITKNYKKYNYIPHKVFHYLLYPYSIDAYAKRFLKIEKLSETISDKNLKKLHALTFLPNGEIALKEFRLDKTKQKRIWFLSSGGENRYSLSGEGSKIKEYISKYYEEISAKVQSSVKTELYTRQ